MNNVLNMIKINFITMLRSTFRARTKRGKALSFAFPVVILGLIVAGMFFMYAPMVKILAEFNMQHYIFVQSGIMTLFFVLIMVTMSASGYIFKTKDYEMLSTLPMPRYQIALSKILSVFLIGFLYAFITFFPSVIIYLVYTPVTFGRALLVIVGFLFVPIIPTAVATLIGLLIARISSRVKHKNLFMIILSFVLMAAYIVFCIYMDDIVDLLTKGGSDFIGASRFILPSVSMYILGFVKLGVLDIVLLVVISVVLFAFMIWLITISYDKISRKLSEVSVAVSKKALSYKESSLMATLIKKEANQYFSYPMWVVNSIIGLVMAIVLPIMMCVSGKGNVNIISAMKILGLDPALMFIILITTMMCIGNIACSSISSEGKNFYVIKSLPIPYTRVLTAKVLFSLILDIPFGLVASTVTIAIYHSAFTVVSGIMLFVVPIIACISMAVFGILINLMYPKIEWQNISEVVKSSVPVFITTIGSMLVNIAFYLMLTKVKLSANISLIIYLALYILILAISLLVLKLRGKKLYNRI